jgi:hypothetical protein
LVEKESLEGLPVYGTNNGTKVLYSATKIKKVTKYEHQGINIRYFMMVASNLIIL